MERDVFVLLITRKVPKEALDYCIQLYEDQPFQFRLSKKRQSKLGDYRFDPRAKSHTVTVNEDLHPYQFLITYVHEVAHRRVHEQHRNLKPHGLHWKNEFRRLMLPLLRPEVFPNTVLGPLARHMKNPKASTSADPALMIALKQFEANSERSTIASLPLLAEFRFRKRYFRKLEVKRTRALCLDLENKKRYLIPLVAEVDG
ncbi:transcription elongation protein SprT [Roseivirga thermotolerans]|uniref:transcription elongation protein SprT n=1 Tax=Roseivirga thermotolerans TaxID=1758176 RepID=UPI00273DDAD2|nr:transcription elongation protein SprT [Roseivirga thermotolerans]